MERGTLIAGSHGRCYWGWKFCWLSPAAGTLAEVEPRAAIRSITSGND
jgi:hypothetical protein